MGADLILSAARWPHVAGSEPPEPADRDTIRDALLAGVANADEGALEEAVLAAFGGHPDEMRSEWNDTFSTWHEWARTELRSAIVELLGDPDVGTARINRDATLLELDGQWWLVAGGTSAGEYPEATEALDQLVAAGLLKGGTTNAVVVRL